LLPPDPSKLLTPAAFSCWSAVDAAVGREAPSAADTSGGRTTVSDAGATAYSASPPPVGKLMEMTLSPGLRSVTSLPSSTTSPDMSPTGMKGNFLGRKGRTMPF